MMKTNKKWLGYLIMTLFVLGSLPALATDTTMDPVALIRQHLQLDSRIHLSNLQMSKRGENVVISGDVASLGEKQLIEETVKQIWGDRYSISGIKVVPPTVPDYEIQKNIATAVPAHCQIEIHDFNIDVKNGNVVLKGKTNALHHKTIAEYVAANIRGVKSVTNTIHVVGTRESDQLIRENILSLLDPYLREKEVQLDVSVNDGKVTLRGEVFNYDEERYIQQTVEKVPGVIATNSSVTIKRKFPAGGREPAGKY